MPQFNGQRNTNLNNAQNQRIRIVDSSLFWLEPEEDPMIQILTRLESQQKTVAALKSERQEMNQIYDTVQVSNNTYNSVATSIVLVDGSGLRVGQQLVVLKDTAVDTSGPEIIRVTARAGNTLTISRGFAGTTAASIAANQTLVVLPQAIAEGGDGPEGYGQLPVFYTDYIAPHRTAAEIPWEAEMEDSYDVQGGAIRKKLQADAIRDLRRKMAMAFYWSKGHEDFTHPDGTMRTTHGLYHSITSNVINVNGLLTPEIMDQVALVARRFGSSDKLFITSPVIAAAFGNWARSTVRNAGARQTKLWGAEVTQIIMPGLTLNMIVDKQLGYDSVGGTTMGEIGFVLDWKNIQMLRPKGPFGGKIVVRQDDKRDGKGRIYDQFVTFAGLRVALEQTHIKIVGVKGFTSLG